MPKLTQTVTATTTTEIVLRPALKRKLLNELEAYAELKDQIDMFTEAADAHKATIRELRESTGEGSLELEGYKITDVQGVSSKLDVKLLLKQGVTLAQIEAATIVKPKKAYELISLPGKTRKGREED